MKSNSTKNFSLITIGQIIATGFHALFYLIFASLLGPEIFGEISYLIALAGIFSIISRFGLPYTVTVYGAKNNTILSNQANVLAIITSAIGAIILLPLNLFAGILSFGISLFYMNQYNLLGFKKYKKLTVTIIVQSILFVILPIILYFIIEIPGIILGLALANLICSFNFLSSLNKKIHSFSELRKNFKVLIHNFGVELSVGLPGIVDKLLIVPLYGFTIVGIYQFNLQILGAVNIIPALLHGFLLSEESSGFSNNKIIYLILTGSVLIAILTIFLAPLVVEGFFPKFSDGIFSLQVLIFTVIPLSLSSIFNAKLQAKESTKVGYSSIIRIGSLLILVTILGELYGLLGLSFAVFMSTSLYAIFLGFLLSKSMKK